MWFKKFFHTSCSIKNNKTKTYKSYANFIEDFLVLDKGQRRDVKRDKKLHPFQTTVMRRHVTVADNEINCNSSLTVCHAQCNVIVILNHSTTDQLSLQSILQVARV